MSALHKPAAFALALMIGMGGFSAAIAQVTLNGAGATFPAPLYTKWFATYSEHHPAVRFKYRGSGSAEGQDLILARAIDFGASDAPLTGEAMAAAAGKILHVPTVGGAVVIIFNLHDVKQLKLDGPTLAGIYLGKITRWNDPTIAGQNPGTRLPEEDIAVVHRTAGSGTTYIFTDYLTTQSPEWKLKVGRYLSVTWPVGVALPGNAQVADFVRKTPGSIGYVELLFAEQNQLTQASIRNATGTYIQATTASVSAAMATAAVPSDFRLSVVNAAGRSAYPISGVTWLLVPERWHDATKSEQLRGFLHWALTDGQKMAAALGYAPLAAGLRLRALQEIDSISAGK